MLKMYSRNIKAKNNQMESIVRLRKREELETEVFLKSSDMFI